MDADSLIPYSLIAQKSGKFEITKLDTINKIVSGIFSFTLYKGGANLDSVTITEGRFDVKLGDVCKCNQ